jgi:flagellar assembly factor FliW
MSIVTIKGKEYFYDETEVLHFAEGLIGLPEMRRAVLIPLEEYEPFCWLASLDDERNRFIVVNPQEIFADYQPQAPAVLNREELKTFTIVTISSDWTQTTINLRAPIFIDARAKRGVQSILTDTSYRLAEALPQN